MDKHSVYLYIPNNLSITRKNICTFWKQTKHLRKSCPIDGAEKTETNDVRLKKLTTICRYFFLSLFKTLQM